MLANIKLANISTFFDGFWHFHATFSVARPKRSGIDFMMDDINRRLKRLKSLINKNREAKFFNLASF